MSAFFCLAPTNNVVNPFHRINQFGDEIVWVRHVDIGPHHDTTSSRSSASATRCTTPRVTAMRDQCDSGNTRQLSFRAIIRTVIDNNEFE